MVQLIRHSLSIPFLPNTAHGLQVAHLTDLHRDSLTQDAVISEAVCLTLETKPDLIVLTGDYVSHRPEDVAPVAELLKPLSAPLGVFGILGNHDFRAGGKRVREALGKAGVTLLNDRSQRLACGLTLVGMTDDIEGDGHYQDAFHGVGRDEAVLALIHNPASAERFSERACAALAGHTHGGQVVVPFLTAWKLRAIYAKRYKAGFYAVGNVNLYVNRGVGNVGVPFRFLARPEVALFTLTGSPVR